MESPFSLKGKNVLITGANGGIGSETARVCAQLGASLYLIDRKAPSNFALEVSSFCSNVVTFEADVTDKAAIEDIVGSIGSIDAVVANAAVCPWSDWADDDWDQEFHKVMDVNVLGVVHLMRACLPKMYKQGFGNAVLVSSIAGRIGGMMSSPHYVASKGGINSLLKWLARKSAPHGVVVNAVAPGATATEMIQNQNYDTAAIPLGRLASPREIAVPISFLCSGAASYISGATLDVNGGVYMG